MFTLLSLLSSTVCQVILHCPAMFSSLNPPLLCWTVDWTPPLSSIFCLFLLFTGEFSDSVSMFPRLFIYLFCVFVSDCFSFFIFLLWEITSPRLSKLPGWNSKDGTLNLEKVCWQRPEVLCFLWDQSVKEYFFSSC